MKVEFWTVKVLLHPGPMKRELKLKDCTAPVQLIMLARVQSGDLAVLPDGCIVEPLECFEQTPKHPAGLAQQEAQEAMLRLAKDDPSGDYRVIMNTDGL